MKKLLALLLAVIMVMTLAPTCVLADEVDPDCAQGLHNWEEATCEAPKTCDDCGATEGEKLPHQFENYEENSDETCTENGTETAICEMCGEAEDTRVIPNSALGHEWDCVCSTECNACDFTREVKFDKETEVEKKATTSKDGKLLIMCKECEEGETVKIPKIKTVSIASKKYVFNNKNITPEIVVTDAEGKELKKGTDYTVDLPSSRKKVGKYKATVKFKGKYSGKKTLNYEIYPKTTNIKKAVSAKKSLKVYIKKQSKEVDGYQVQYSAKENFASAKTKTLKKNQTSITLKALGAKKTYYVRVRTYKKSGKKYYSDWSAVISKKTK